MKKNGKKEPKPKKWVVPELSAIQGLDSCVDFLYIGDEGNASGGSNDNRPPWEK